MPGCDDPGHYRAPKDPQNLRQFYWFCIEHVRAYNASWDYYRNMDIHTIDQQRKDDVTWQRPSWPIGASTQSADHTFQQKIDDFISDMFGDAIRRRQASVQQLPLVLIEALATMALTLPVAMEHLKKRYKELVKLHHPDLKGGDKDAEEHLKKINQAYTELKKVAH